MAARLGPCELCGIESRLEKHHLIPQRMCRGQLKGLVNDPSNHAYICGACHRTVHAYYSERELKDRLGSVAELKADQRFSKFLEWRVKHPTFESDSAARSGSWGRH